MNRKIRIPEYEEQHLFLLNLITHKIIEVKKEADEKEALIWSFQVLDLAEIQDQKDFNYEKLKQELARYLDRLIVEDFNHLIAVLYRIDISQENVTAALAAKGTEETAGVVMAELIIERQLQKIETRRKYS